MNETWIKKLSGLSAALLIVAATLTVTQSSAAQDQRDDPPGRVARLGYMQGSVSIQPSGESEWVGAVANRPITTGDKIWADRDSRVEVALGSATIRLAPNTGFSFLNLDDRATQIELTSGSLNIRVRRLDRDDVFEIDTPNQAFSVFRPGNYRVDASDDGTYTVVSVRDGEGESTGNGQTYTLHAGQRGTFSGTDSLRADVVDIEGSDQFDNWAQTRDRRYQDSRSARYVSSDVVGYEDLDDNGDWRDDSNYGHVWYPNRVASGWAPYREGHWDWISPWGWTWVDDASWGYAPFHYGRWVTVGGRWGWVAGPAAVRAVYAPALVVFIGGGGGGFGVNVGWFPLGPREVYVPSYQVSRGYVDRVNISNTNVNVTNITNVYNTTIVNNTTNVTNVTYVNRNIQGAVTAVPQRSFVSAQPVAKARVTMNAREISSASLTTRVAVAPTRESVLGGRATTVNRVTAPPENIRNRAVIAKAAPPPPPVPFAKQQAALEQHPGQPLARHEVQSLRPVAAPEAHPMVKIAPPGKPTTPNMGRPENQPNQPGNQPHPGRPDQPSNAPVANRPGASAPGQPASPAANRPDKESRPNERPGASNPEPADRPRPAQPNNPPESKRPETKSQPAPPVENDRKPASQPDRQPDMNRPNDRRESNPTAAEPVQPNNHPDHPAANNRQPDAQPNDHPAHPAGNNHEPGARPNDRPGLPARKDSEPNAQPNDRPAPPAGNNRPDAQPNNHPAPPAGNNRQPDAQPNNHPDRPAGNNREPAARPNDHPVSPPENRSAHPANEPPKPLTPEEKKQKQKQEQEKREQQKRDEKPPAN